MPARLIVVLSVALSLVAVPASAAPGTSMEAALDATSVTAGTPIGVSGTLETSAQPAERLWVDPTFASDLGSFQYPVDPDTDLVEGWVEHARPGDPLTMRIKLAPALGVDLNGKAYQWYRWPFQLEERWYFVEITYVPDGAGGAWAGSWYYCKLALGPNCIHGTTPPFPVTYDAEARTLTGRIPISDLAAVQPDGTLAQDTMRPFSNQYPPEAGYKQAVQVRLDSAAPFEPYELPLESVFVAVAPATADPLTLDYAETASVTVTPGSSQVAFGASVGTVGLEPGEYAVFLKGCFGPCSYRALPFTVTG